MNRYQITAMTVSAATLVGIAGYEGYKLNRLCPRERRRPHYRVGDNSRCKERGHY